MQKDLLRKTFGSVLLVLAFGTLTYLYLYPGSQYLFEGREDIFLSDGTDSLTQAHQYGLMNEAFLTHPSRFLFGAVYTQSLDSPEGYAVWVTWPERFFIVVANAFISLEQIPTAWSFFLLMMTALSMFALGRALKWSFPLNFALSLAWTFSAYTRARAKVHTGFLGLYFLPLIFLGLWILHKGRGWRSTLTASLLMLLAAMTAQYYILMLAFLALFPALFYFVLEDKTRSFKRSLIRLIAAAAPAAFFCIYCVMFSIPSEFNDKIPALPVSGISESWPHPFLEAFAARPLDYFSGDTGIGFEDIIPFRQRLSQYNFETNPLGNNHERTNGIRWTLWLLLIALGVATLCTKSSNWSLNKLVLVFLGFGIGGLLLSFPPSYFGGFSPSVLLNSLVSQFRVSSRAGIFVSFSVLMMIGLLYTQFESRWTAKAKRWTWLLPALLLVDLPPVYQEMPSTIYPPKIERLKDMSFETCGFGLFFPYVSSNVMQSEHYMNLSRLRGSGCGVFNSHSPNLREQKMALLFGPSENLLTAVRAGHSDLANKIVQVAQCTQMSFISFLPPTQQPWAESICSRLDGTLDSQGLCLRKRPVARGMTPIDSCL